MYSPKISEALIPRIYQVAKEQKIPMTRWVNRVVEGAIPQTGVTRESSLSVSNDAGGPRPESGVAAGKL